MSAYPLFSAGFARGYAVTCRPYLCFVSGVTGLAGLAATKSLSTTGAVVLGVVFFLAYAFGQALTDVTQIDTDRLSAPYRPLVRGEIRARDVLVVSFFGLSLCALALVLFDRRAAIGAAVAVAGLASYTPLKRRYWAGPIHNSWIVATLPVLAALADGRSVRALVLDPDLLALIGTAFFGYMTFVLLGYLKDVEADRKARYETIAVRFGRRATVAVSFVAALAAISAAAHVIVRAGSNIAHAVFVVAAAMLLGGHVRAWRIVRDSAAWPAIVMGLRGYVALQVAVTIALAPKLLLVGALSLVAFEIALARRPCQEQV